MLAGPGLVQPRPERRGDRLKANEPSTWSEEARAAASGERASACFAWLCIGFALGSSHRRGDSLERLDLPSEMMAWAEAYGSDLLGASRAGQGAALMTEAPQRSHETEPSPSTFRLTATETIVANLVAEGRSNKQIAAELVVSLKTVEYHISNIYRRLGVTSRVKLAQLVRVAA